ncbi:site-specific DNA-methyltransferase [Alteromonas macleodii]|uniref:Methyltransferase n=1 Tax=Alteromonas macleodii TaxID=28108 RepID=A0AB36FKQ2_ALTMA|nr:site-specific DNA-methyltransferase [Alteromonas macleodii]OES24471.1 DNA methylase family protein [Alteromonas macleodii]OES25528.1 DNA methylase family protein [Alteromonas macleodii]OES25829.1 DNA methylase family protein [Alteromonas macleodii]OES38649.1 DNA methylase family protein [Alteromonas macleodii]
MQRDLFDTVINAYGDDVEANEDVYERVSDALHTDLASHVKPVGKAQAPVNVLTRKIRWVQQSLKRDGLIERVGQGQWRLTREGKFRLTQINANKYMVAAHTELGVYIWARSEHVFNNVIDSDIHLCLTSPPYIGIERSYGTHTNEQAYIDWLLSILTPIRQRMVKGASLCLNISNDSVVRSRFGARSMYLEKLTLKMAEELELELMDRLCWFANNKAPGPTQFTSIRRTHLLTKYEPILWFCTDAEHCFAHNANAKQPYSAQMKKLIAEGGESTTRTTPDSKHGVKPGDFANDNGGALFGNVLQHGINCAEKNQLVKEAERLGLAPNNATFPVALAKTLIQWLCPEGGLVVDPFGGYATTGSAAEQTNRRWLCTEMHWDYIRVALARFKQRAGYFVNPRFLELDEPLIRRRFASA